MEMEGWEFAKGVKEVTLRRFTREGGGRQSTTLICVFRVNCLLHRERWVEIIGH